MKLKEICNNLFYIGFNKTKNQNETFVRFHGSYENPKFHDTIFTKKQFDKWFKKNTEEGMDLGIDFYSMQAGFNIPDYVFTSFVKRKFDPLSNKEKKLLNEVKKISKEKFYVISSLQRDKSTFNHEVAHGLFYLNSEYKKDMKNFFKTIDNDDYVKMQDFINSESLYSEERINDEIHATLISSYYKFSKVIKNSKIMKYATNINQIFKKYSSRIKGIEPFRL